MQKHTKNDNLLKKRTHYLELSLVILIIVFIAGLVVAQGGFGRNSYNDPFNLPNPLPNQKVWACDYIFPVEIEYTVHSWNGASRDHILNVSYQIYTNNRKCVQGRPEQQISFSSNDPHSYIVNTHIRNQILEEIGNNRQARGDRPDLGGGNVRF